MDSETRNRIQSLIEGNDIVLFMKGTPAAPRCGFSATVVQILDSLGAQYASVDVLSDPEVREGIKEFSDWPTIPQLYVRREFVGGCDIVKDMYGSGELEEKVGVKGQPQQEGAPPKVTVTARAAEALRAAIESEEEGVRFEIGPRFDYSLSIGPKQARDIVVESNGVELLLDRASAQRANGTTIDYVTTDQGAAFKIDNPNEPPRVRQMSPRELSERMKRGDALTLFDVRTPQEREMASIAGSTFFDREGQKRLVSLPKDTLLVFHCHHGPRSQQAAELALSHGFRNVHNLAGGIDAWAIEVDPNVPRY